MILRVWTTTAKAAAFAFAALACASFSFAQPPAAGKLQVSGVYPHLAAFSTNGECGIGAVVPWAGKLWMITYPPHATTGSADKLYQIDPQLNVVIRPESVARLVRTALETSPEAQLETLSIRPVVSL